MASLLLLIIGLMVSSAYGSSYPTEVVELTDSNFEHDTQAASGQTTGVWAVLFTDSTVKRNERASLVIEQLAQDEEKELIYARVDVAYNVRLARRFGELIFPPCILLFRDRQLYVFDKSFDRDDILDQVREFVTDGYADTTPLKVPEPRERKMDVEAFEKGNKVDMKIVFCGLLMIVGGLVFQTWAIMNKDKFKPEPESTPAAPAGAVGSTAASAGQATAEKAKGAKGKAKAS